MVGNTGQRLELLRRVVHVPAKDGVELMLREAGKECVGDELSESHDVISVFPEMPVLLCNVCRYALFCQDGRRVSDTLSDSV